MANVRVFLSDVPKVDLSVHSATSQKKRVCGVESQASQAVGHLEAQIGRLGIEFSSENTPCADCTEMLAPGSVVVFAISNSKCCSIARPSHVYHWEICINFSGFSVCNGLLVSLVILPVIIVLVLLFRRRLQEVNSLLSGFVSFVEIKNGA